MTDIETAARQLARKVIAVPGWAAELPAVRPAIRQMMEAVAGTGDSPPAALCNAIADRAEVILTDMATADPEIIFANYLDLLPADLVAMMTAKAMEVLKEAGAEVRTLKDEAGTTFIGLGNVEALGLPAGMMEALGETAPKPVGKLHPVH